MVFNKLPMPGLRHRCLVKIAVTICNDNEIRAVVEEYGSASFVFLSKETQNFLKKPPTSICDEVNQLRINECHVRALMRCKTSQNAEVHIKSDKNCLAELRMPTDILPSKKWEELVESKISSTSLPRSLRDELFFVVRLMTFEIDNWITDHSEVVLESAKYQCSLQWKPQGKIDRKKTAQVLISDESICILGRYNFACLYCLEEEAYSLWSRMSSNQRKNSWLLCRFVPFWYVNDWMYSEGGDHERPNVHSPIKLRQSFTEFFRKRRQNYLVNSVYWKTMDYEDFILSLPEVDANNRGALFKTCAVQVLEYFLDWPLQNQFVDVANLLWPYLTEKNFHELLVAILYRRIMVGWVDYDYVSLLNEFWSHSPGPYKEFIQQDCIYEPLMFTMNYNNPEPFPNELLLAYFKEEYLMFRYQGVKYCLFKNPKTFDKGTSWRTNTYSEFNKGCKRISGILFSKIGKRKHKQLRL